MTCRTLEEFYHINGRSFEKQYKETLSGYRSWDQLSHAQKWLLFEDNIGKNIKDPQCANAIKACQELNDALTAASDFIGKNNK